MIFLFEQNGFVLTNRKNTSLVIASMVFLTKGISNEPYPPCLPITMASFGIPRKSLKFLFGEGRSIIWGTYGTFPFVIVFDNHSEMYAVIVSFFCWKTA